MVALRPFASVKPKRDRVVRCCRGGNDALPKHQKPKQNAASPRCQFPRPEGICVALRAAVFSRLRRRFLIS